MKIRIENLGPVQEACIDLDKRLTVFCGQNNTGKTYVSYLLYGLTKRIEGLDWSERSLHDDSLHHLVTGEYECTVPIDMYFVDRLRKDAMQNLGNELGSIFGLSQVDSVNQWFYSLNISFEKSADEVKNKILEIEFQFDFYIDNYELQVRKSASEELIHITSNLPITNSAVIGITMAEVDKRLAYYPLTSSIFFPVERSSIYTFNKELSIKRNDLIEQIQGLSRSSKQDPFEYVNKRSTRYPLVIRDGLKLAEDLVNESKQLSDFHEFADEIEQVLLHGSMSVSTDGEVLFASDKNKSKNLPIHMSASIVKTLASFIFYLRHQAKENELVIIDEPEINLHPESQVILTRILARMVNKGFRLLISTHSDYIIRELNNLILISDESPAVQKMAQELNYDTGKEAIKPEDVGAYRFHYTSPKAEKVTVDEIKVEKDGIEVIAMDDVTAKQSTVSGMLSDALYYGEED